MTIRVRPLLIATAIVSSLLGAVIAYLVLTVPNDLKSGALLRQARSEVASGNQQDARKTLKALIQQYPRTDAAAAATVALISLVDDQQSKLARDFKRLQSEEQNAQKLIASLTGRVEELAKQPAPPEPVLTTPQPAPRPKIVVTRRSPAKRPAVKPRARRG